MWLLPTLHEQAWLGCLALSLLSFSWIWSTVAQRPQLHLLESGRDLEAKRRFGGLLGCYWYRCPCSAAVRQLVFVMLLMQVVSGLSRPPHSLPEPPRE